MGDVNSLRKRHL
ncbi:hypothetical protein PFTANZ_05258 [Plasmodium falciparum Tanzania (2000708)]|uniref:Uncharacterized protein n=1 Tax=Plasmodium falciparum Tanzania (2000708) TaxID=1036725 RepID=A0A024W0K5_PLAFA|nr:hypothetical protein PFTANZ_05258 [Plasmodium falciparum Tanzania (2000708)]